MSAQIIDLFDNNEEATVVFVNHHQTPEQKAINALHNTNLTIDLVIMQLQEQISALREQQEINIEVTESFLNE